MQESLFPSSALEHYKVLARKYRPKNFSELIGQEVMVRTFVNSVQLGRLAHAYLLTGIRGVGKTTAARIFAKAFNCIGHDGNSHVTAEPCNQCTHCKMISGDKHQDVIEIDAASNTGVNDIRDIIQDTKYRPTSARFKVYIIDEVHMLSINAFNALLKTLEEPPAHVKFVFATTELKKIPITIISRCQRFDLRRVSLSELAQHFAGVVSAEGFSAEPAALDLIANCAAGSVRDGLSLLDQALAMQAGVVTAENVRNMLGLADVGRVYDLYQTVVKGEIHAALSTARCLYDDGVDPAAIVQDLLNINYYITKTRFTPEIKLLEVPEAQQQILAKLAVELDVVFLSRAWQMLLKGLEEVQKALLPFACLEMLLIRITHANISETPESLLKKLDGSSVVIPTAPVSVAVKHNVTSFAEVVNLCLQHEEMLLYHNLQNHVQPQYFAPNCIHLHFLADAPRDLSLELKQFLLKLTGENWQIISVDSAESGSMSLASQEQQERNLHKQQIAESPLVQNILNHFTELEIAAIKVKH